MVHERKDGNLIDKDEARTPPGLFKLLDDRWHFDVDVAAKKANALCRRYFGEDYTGKTENALVFDWLHSSFQDGVDAPFYGKAFYCNPPYSPGNIEPFCKKAYEESLKGAIVVMLLPSDTSTGYFHKYCMKAAEIIFLWPRVRFNNPDGTPMKGSPKFGSMVVVFQTHTNPVPTISSMRWK